MRHSLIAAAALLAATSAHAEAPSPFAGTMAEMTYVEVERAAASGAVALWAIGAIEAHGPHLPLSTDVIAPQGQLRLVQAGLAKAGVKSVIAPPYYWGVNRVTGAFAGSFDVRPEVMVELMSDVFAGLAKAGFKEAYVVTGHFDSAHGQAIVAAVRRANAEGKIAARFVVPAGLGQRLGLRTGEPGFILVDAAPSQADAAAGDLHAGEAETSLMMHLAPDLVREGARKGLPPVKLAPEVLPRWREGYDTARKITPDGYVGSPAEARAARGRGRLEAEAASMAAAIVVARR
jgi:creatinine amidohydrolase